MQRSRLILAALATCLLALAAPGSASASKSMDATFQDDPLLVYGTPEVQQRTLDRLDRLGVDRIRVSVFWKLVAPQSTATQRPAFDAANPAAYPPGAWSRYDNLLRFAQQRGIAINFNITSPAPHWATGNPPADRPDLKETWAPDAAEFEQFVRAVGTRYSGSYVPPGTQQPPLPRVDYWSIWNEPNQAGWLTPQWVPDPRAGEEGQFEAAAALYRELFDAAWTGLHATGHGGDTILVGETAPKGQKERRDITQSLDALRFLRNLYCLDDNGQFYTGDEAVVRGCPADEPAATFIAQHPGLFEATGYAHHPYELTFAPDRESGWDDWVTMADLKDLQRELRRIWQRYGRELPTKHGVPIYLTEFGYQTDPPDRTGVTFKNQARYINHAEYLAWRNPGVRTFSQFLLHDDGEPISRTFQSGLMTNDRKFKPAYRAYRVGLHVYDEKVRRGEKIRVWGVVRPAKGESETVRVQFRNRSSKGRKTQYHTRAHATARQPAHYLRRAFTARRSGWVRLVYGRGDRAMISRSQYVSVSR